jgi:transcriptional regulator with XRE-family HTH domain
MTQRQNPMTQQRRLRAELRRARERAKMTQKEVAHALDWSNSKIVRIETGAVGLSVTDLRALLQLYDVTDQASEDELVDLLRSGRQRAWWDEHRPYFAPQLINFIALEASASVTRQFQSFVIPGLLQTPDYSRAVLSAYTTDSETIERAIRVRSERQRVLAEEPGLTGHFILDESVVRRQLNGPELMRNQLEHLKELNRRPNIAIQVLTFDQGVHDGMQTSFQVFEFPDEDQDHIVFLDKPGHTVLSVNDPDDVSRYVEAFLKLEELASDPADLDAVIDPLLTTRADYKHN